METSKSVRNIMNSDIIVVDKQGPTIFESSVWSETQKVSLLPVFDAAAQLMYKVHEQM